MNLEQYIAQLREIAQTLQNSALLNERVTIVAAKTVEAFFKRRIFVKGLDAQEKKIGDYSTKPLYINPKAKTLIGVSKRGLKAQGKDGKDTFKNGKKKKTAYLADGYKELREKTGRQSKAVDLNLSGAGFNSIQTGKKSERVVLGFTNKERQKILEGNERRFKKQIFSLSANERNEYQEAANREIRAIIREILNKK